MLLATTKCEGMPCFPTFLLSPAVVERDWYKTFETFHEDTKGRQMLFLSSSISSHNNDEEL